VTPMASLKQAFGAQVRALLGSERRVLLANTIVGPIAFLSGIPA